VNRSAPYLSDPALLHRLHQLVARERAATAVLLDHLAEVDQRKLFLPAAYESMFAYCVGELHLSEDAAYKRIQASRAAARFPAIFDAVAEGRLHLSAVCLLAPHLTEDTAEGLLEAATHRSKKEVERLLALRFPRPDLPDLVQPILVATLPAPAAQLAPGQVQPDGLVDRLATPLTHSTVLENGSSAGYACPWPVGGDLSPGTVSTSTASVREDRPAVKPLAPGRFMVRFTMGQSAHDKLRYVQELLSHELPSGDMEQIFEQALDALIPRLERRKFAATSSPRSGHGRPTKSLRHIPADVMRAVWERDQGQCTYVSESGHRCQARKFVEFDHVLEVARGGEASVSDLRLLCRAHNQHQAECTFGAEFMRHKRIAAREARAARSG
jgi:hypothetical protein